MKSPVYSILLLLMVSNLSCWNKEEDKPVSNALRAAPSFVLSDTKNRKTKLQDLMGTVTIVHFWATWCPPCLEEIPKWVKAAEAYKQRPMKWIAISLDQNWDEALKLFPDSLAASANIISLIDPQLKVSEDFGSFQFPETYILNKKHEIVSKLVGPQNWQGAEIKNLLEKILEDAAKL